MSSAANKDITIFKNELVIYFGQLTEKRRQTVLEILYTYRFNATKIKNMEIFRVPRFLLVDKKKVDLARVICSCVGVHTLHEWSKRSLPKYDEKISLAEILKHSYWFASIVKDRRQQIIDILTDYETYRVANDEIDRALDLFMSLHENSTYYQRRINGVISFLPRNQPLYALSCFGLVLSYMVRSAYICIPSYMKLFFDRLIECLDLHNAFPNVIISYDRRETINFCSQLIYNPGLQCWIPRVEVVVFTGNPKNAKKVKNKFNRGVLFIGNGAGHNPVIITPSANIEKAVEVVLELQLYNQGQDCAAPNSFLVHRAIYDQFIEHLITKIKKVQIGPYKDRSSIVGPVTKIEDLACVQKILIKNRQWVHKETPGVMHIASKIVEPTIIAKPLSCGANYTEQFSPIFFIQKYCKDLELAQYFETQQYWQNAMYVTVCGYSEYVEKLVNYRLPNGKILHTESTIIRNTHLHAKGVERGTKPYGGYGRNASWISIDDYVISKPTLPQRDIFQYIILPSLNVERIPILYNKDRQMQI